MLRLTNTDIQNGSGQAVIVTDKQSSNLFSQLYTQFFKFSYSDF
jgi:hypothetical protein